MDWFPLYNSLRITIIATFITFFLGIFFAWYIAKVPPFLKGVLDALLTLPMVLPPTVVGFFLLALFGPKGQIGRLLLTGWEFKITMTWYASILAVIVVTLPLMYRTARGAFEAFDKNLIYAGQTLGLSGTYIFWRIVMPGCGQGILAGLVLAFARGLGEYGATSMVSGYTPGRTATISTTVYQLWREGNDALAYRWILVNLALSFLVLSAFHLLQRENKGAERQKGG